MIFFHVTFRPKRLIPAQEKRTRGMRIEQQQFNVQTDSPQVLDDTENVQHDAMQIEEEEPMSTNYEVKPTDKIAMSIASKKRFETAHTNINI